MNFILIFINFLTLSEDAEQSGNDLNPYEDNRKQSLQHTG